ncbi:MAG: SMP-30/gluconolactonase/LRE family protein [Chloroflexi bacterium]|nr:SMP-30/gluconolactonase/LRE family protein [Chloroflexota bacterium]
MQAELLFDAKALLGEGPIWDARTQTLYWIDILEKRVYAEGNVLAQLDDFIGCIAPRVHGGLVLTTRFGFASLEVEPVKLTPLASPADEPATNRFNDGKCDPRGRFLAGTMNLNETDPTGSLYSFDGSSITKLLGGVTISNGMAWSPDHKTFYYIDTPTREVKAFDYDVETGAIANPRVVIRVIDGLGWPDGMTSDMQGNLWIAMWGGAQVTKWDPASGQLLKRIPVPAKNVSSCVFGGKNRNELYLTSARKGLDEIALAEYPLTGGVFRLETDVEGMPTFEFAG